MDDMPTLKTPDSFVFFIFISCVYEQPINGRFTSFIQTLLSSENYLMFVQSISIKKIKKCKQLYVGNYLLPFKDVAIDLNAKQLSRAVGS